MNAKPLRNRILVLADKARDDVTSAGIVIAAREGLHESQKQLGRTGTVVSIGEEIDRDQLKVGDRVCFGEFEYQEYVENHVRYLIMQDADIAGVIES